MNQSTSKSYGNQLEEYKAAIANCKLFGVGLAGTLACVAVGALGEDQDGLREVYFLTLAIGAVLIGWSRYFAGSRAERLQRCIDRKRIKPNEALQAQRFSVLHRTYFHLVLCIVSLYTVGWVLLCALWHPISSELQKHAGVSIGGGIAIFLFMGGILVRKGCVADQINPTYVSERLDDSICNVKKLSEHLPYKTCKEVIAGSKKMVKRINLLGLVLLAQLTCLAADALRPVNETENIEVSMYMPLAFTFIIVYGLSLGYARLAHEQAERRMQKELKAGRLAEAAFPHIVPMLELARVNHRALGYAIAVPALTITLGILSFWHVRLEEVATGWWVAVSAFIIYEFPARGWILADESHAYRRSTSLH